MNFMSGRPGFHEQATGSKPMSSSPSSSSSSSFQHRGLPTYSHHHHGGGGGGREAPQLPESSSTNNGGGGDEAADDSDYQILLRRGGEGSSSAMMVEKEHMFDKVVTPSDVGKLNRLVIPKQHAEKYFPLDSSANEKGLLLNFEDRNGKPWRFRYSYWNSSQSYVMTKGWSRFVKEKKLDAGDVVSFQRGADESAKDRLFIDWRRRPEPPELLPPFPTFTIPNQFSLHRPIHHPYSSLYLQPPSREYSHLIQANAVNRNHPAGYGPYSAYSSTIVNGNPCPPSSIFYLRSAPGAAGGGGGAFAPQHVRIVQAQWESGVDHQMVFESVPVVQGKAAAKRLRLFGVNMDCPISESDECDILASTTLPHSQIPLELLPHPHFDSSSPSSSSVPSLQLSPYNPDDDDKGKGSMSLDLDM